MQVRGRVSSVKTSTKMQTLQVDLLAGESKDRMEHFEPYGWTSHPHPGAEVAATFLDGDRSHGLVLVVADRRYRLTTLQEGEVVVHDDLGQKVHLTREGIIVEGGGLPMIFRDTPSMLFQADNEIRFETTTFKVVSSTLTRFESPRTENTGLLLTQQLTIGLTGAGTATMNGGTITYTGVTLNYMNSTQEATGGSIRHDNKNVGSTHTHPETGSTTQGPNP
jgi:phage baseplate assembly protein V